MPDNYVPNSAADAKTKIQNALHNPDGADSHDVLFGVLFMLGGLQFLNLGTFELGGANWALADTFVTIFGQDVTWAIVLSAISLMAAYATNFPSWSDFGDIESVAVVVAALTVLSVFITPLYDLFTMNTTVSWFVMILNAGAFGAIIKS